ncbi:TolC family protein, partial [bacterium]|nr:TolC family protein [bacterium]
TGGAIAAANRAAEARVDDALAQTRSVEQSLHAALVDRYFGVCLAEQASVIRRQVLAGIEQHLQQAVRLEAEGMISRAERLHAEVSRAEADRELRAADQDVLLANAALRSLLHEETEPRPTSRLFVMHDLPALADLQRDAAKANPDLLRLEARQELARSALTVERSSYLPDVALFARYELYPDDLTALDPRWAAGIGLQLDLFDGFAREHRVKAARATVSMVDHAQQSARDEIALLVEYHYRGVLKSLEQFDVLDATLALAGENLRVRQRAFEEGMATSLDVVDAVNMLTGVELARLAAAHDFVTALADLLAATGQAQHFADYMERADVEVTW